MTVKPNRLKEKLNAGEIGLGFSVNYLRSPDVAAIANACGYDWIKLDPVITARIGNGGNIRRA